MELIQIIYKILLVGGALLFVVISASFLIARSRKKELKNSIQIVPNIGAVHKESAGRNLSGFLHHNTPNNSLPVVYNINPSLNGAVKIIRKPTASKQEIHDQMNREERFIKKTSVGKGNKRYTIVNDEMKKSFNPTVINF